MYQGNNAAARAEVQELVKGARNDGEQRAAFLNVAIVDLEGGHTDRALAQLRSGYAVAERGKDVPAMVQDATFMGDVELEAGRADQALRHYRQINVARVLAGTLVGRDFGIAWQSRWSLHILTGQDFRYDEHAWLEYLTGPNKPLG